MKIKDTIGNWKRILTHKKSNGNSSTYTKIKSKNAEDQKQLKREVVKWTKVKKKYQNNGEREIDRQMRNTENI